MLHTTIVAVGIDEPTAQHLITTGHALENPGPSAEALFGRMVAAPADALILGNQTSIDGSFVERIRAHKIDTPAIRIADGPRDEYWSHACAHFLDCGGDDVIVGPANPEEVACSIRTVCRRMQPDHVERFAGEEITIEVNLTKKRITVNGRSLVATPYEMALLFVLASISGAVSRATLCKNVWGWHEFNQECIDVFVCRLRKHLGHGAPLLGTVRGVGYELLGRVH